MRPVFNLIVSAVILVPLCFMTARPAFATGVAVATPVAGTGTDTKTKTKTNDAAKDGDEDKDNKEELAKKKSDAQKKREARIAEKKSRTPESPSDRQSAAAGGDQVGVVGKMKQTSGLASPSVTATPHTAKHTSPYQIDLTKEVHAKGSAAKKSTAAQNVKIDATATASKTKAATAAQATTPTVSSPKKK